MRAVLDDALDWSGQVRRRRDLNLLLVGYLCALRRGELCALRLCDVEIQRGKAIVTIPKSKSDQEYRGVRLAIVRPDDVAPHVDAVRHLAAWKAFLRDGGAIESDPLFPALNRHGDVLPPRDEESYASLGPQSWSERLAELAREAKVFGDDTTGRYDSVSGHSLRRGFVTTAILAGHDPIAVAKQTRHKNLDMLLTYADQLRMLEGTDWAALQFGADVPNARRETGPSGA